ncbi:MAG: phospholipid carrier-dependent glycosyltransferase [Chloroflexota bacterium]
MQTHLGKAIPIGIILIFFYLAVSSLVDDSPAMDEQNHLGRGVAYLNSGDPRLNVEHPPLVNLLAALPTGLLDLDIPLNEPSWQERKPPETFWYAFAETLFWERQNPVEQMIFLGRLPIVILTISLGMLAYLIGNRLWEKPAGLIAMAGILFDPNIITNGRYITTDLGGTFFILLATVTVVYSFKQTTVRQMTDNGMAKIRHSLPLLLLTALTIGLAFGAKLTSILFIPIWIVLAFVSYGQKSYARGVAQRILFLAGAGLLSLFVLWGIYRFEWGHFLFISDGMMPYNRFQGPMPTFWSGIERIADLSGSGSGRDAFLLGEFSPVGFWHYFPVAFSAKTPLVTLIALPLAILLLAANQTTRRRLLCLLIPAVGYFLLAMNSSLNIGYRHLLPILPFCYLIIAGGISAIREQPAVNSQPSTNNNQRLTIYRLLLTIFCFLLLTTSLTIHPHYISFFNQLYGGPSNGYKVLIDSNLDWGQDLKRLEWWMFENGVTEINLAWYGSSDPSQLNINHQPIPGFPRPEFLPLWWDVPFDRNNPPPGVYAISPYNYWEMPLRPEDKTVYAWFRSREPDDRIGYSIFIYIVE